MNKKPQSKDSQSSTPSSTSSSTSKSSTNKEGRCNGCTCGPVKGVCKREPTKSTK